MQYVVVLFALMLADQPTVQEQQIGEALMKLDLPLVDVPPDGAPDPSAWPGVTNHVPVWINAVQTSKANGNPLAVMVVREGICLDVETPCVAVLRCEFSMRENFGGQAGDVAARYALASMTGTVQGWSQSHDVDENGVAQRDYWIRRGTTWVPRVPDSEDYLTDKGMLDWVASNCLDPRRHAIKNVPSTQP